MQRVVMLVLAGVVGIGAPASLEAQDAGKPVDLSTVLSRSDVGTYLRAGTRSSFVEGFLVDFAGVTLELRNASGLHRVDLGPGEHLWAAVDAKRTGALVGALAGVALTAGFCLETFDECGLDVGLLVVTPALALIGAGIGAQLTAWRILPSPSG